MKKVLLFLKKEILELIPPTIFFYIAFSVQSLMRNLAADQYNITLMEYASTFIAALIVAKSILIVDMLPFARKVGSKHLIVNVIWKIFLNITVVMLFRGLEKFIPMISESGGLAEAGRQTIENFIWPQFWLTLIVHILFLVIYGNVTALIHVLGRKRFFHLLMGPIDGNLAE